MEKLNGKIKGSSLSFHKSKKSNLNLKGIEEYQSCIDIIKKENETNEDIYKIGQNLLNIYDKILSATNEYTKKIDQIYENLKPNESSYEGRIEKIIYNILNKTSNALKSIYNKIHFIKNRDNSEGSDVLKKNKDDLVEKLIEKIKKLKQQRNLYLEEMNNYEIYLVNKELGLVEIDEGKNTINEKEKVKEKENKSNIQETFFNDNHTKVCEQQGIYIKCKDELKNFIKVFFTNLNSERKLLYNSIHSNSSDLVNYINTELSNLNEYFKEEIKLINKNNIDNIYNYIDGDNLVNQIIEDDFYTFKFVLRDMKNKNKDFNNKIEDNSKIKKKKKEKEKAKINNDIDNLYEKLDDNNILNMIKEAENNQLYLSQKTKDKMKLLENKKYIESIIDLIIKDPENYDEGTKNKYIDILESNEEYQKTFLQYLNNYRGSGRTGFNKSTIIIFSDLFKLVLNKAVKNYKYELVNFIIVLSLTYYHLKEDETPEGKANDNNKNEGNNENNDNNGNNKIYISEYLKQDQNFQDLSFWQNYLDELIKIEKEKLKKIKDISLITEKQNMNAICSSIFTLIQNMLDYDSEFEFMISILEKIVEKYKIDDDNKINMTNYITSKMNK